MENEWPLARTRWTKFYLDPGRMRLSREPIAQSGKVEYEALGRGLTFSTPPLERRPRSPDRLRPSSSSPPPQRMPTSFLIVRVFDPNGKELTFQGALDPNTPIAQGWLGFRTAGLTRNGASRTNPITRMTEWSP